MSDAIAAASPVRASLAMLGRAPGGFLGDPRFATRRAPTPLPSPVAEPQAEAPDPILAAHAAGYDQGIAEARGEAAAERAACEATWKALSIAAARLDAEQTRLLADRLRETVIALCEAALGECGVPLLGAVLDPAVAPLDAQCAAWHQRIGRKAPVRRQPRPDQVEIVGMQPDHAVIVGARQHCGGGFDAARKRMRVERGLAEGGFA